MITSTFVKWSGSKRSQSAAIVAEIAAAEHKAYFEPFLGSGAVLGRLRPKRAIVGDNYGPLVQLWNLVKTAPELVGSNYAERWTALQDTGPARFYEARKAYNSSGNPHDLLFLTRTCVNGLIRFNAQGEFNNSFHLSRPGIHPDRLGKVISEWSDALTSVDIKHGDYRDTTAGASRGDLVYLDPPYVGTTSMYASKIDHTELQEYLEELNRRGVRWVLSYDGTTEHRIYDGDISNSLYKRRLLLPSGHSTFRKTQQRSQSEVHESLILNF